MSDGPPRKPALDRIIGKKELGQYVPYTPQHIHRLENAGKFPKRVQLGPNRVGWFESDLVAWMESLKAQRDGNGGSDEPVTA